MGDGVSILVTKDPWLPMDGLGMVTTNLGNACKEVRVIELFQPRSQQWDWDLISYLFNPRDREVILNMPLSLKCTADKWYWTIDDMGLYSVKSGYKIRRFHEDEDRAPIWTILWNLSNPLKCCHFMWCLLKGILPIPDNLRSHMVNIPSLCLLCARDRESTHHLILQCPIAQEC